MLADRGDPHGREMAVRFTLLAGEPELLGSLRDFALGQRGPDALRHEVAQALVLAGLLPPGQVRMWLRGAWQEVVLFAFEIHDEPQRRHLGRVLAIIEEAVPALRRGEAERAEHLLLEATELAPEAPDVWNNLAVAYELQGRYREARELLDQVVGRFPDNLLAQVALARLSVQEGDLDRAEALLRPLLDRKRWHVSEFAALCMAQIDLWLARRKPDGARTWLDLWESADPDNPDVAEYRRLLERPTWSQRLLGRGTLGGRFKPKDA